MAKRVVDVLVPVALDRAYSYRVPDDMALKPGDIVSVPLGARAATAVVWAENPTPNPRLDNRLKDIDEKLDVPPLKDELRGFVDWVSTYTLSPRGMVLRMGVRMGEGLGPARERIGVRLAGPPPKRQTAARNRVLALLADGLVRGKTDAAIEAGVSPGVINGLIDEGTLETLVLPPEPVMRALDPDYAPAEFSPAQQTAAAALVAAVAPAAIRRRCSRASPARARPRSISRRSPRRCGSAARRWCCCPRSRSPAQFLDRVEARFGARPAEWHSRRHPGRAPPRLDGGRDRRRAAGGRRPLGAVPAVRRPRARSSSTRSTTAPTSRRTARSTTPATWRCCAPRSRARRWCSPPPRPRLETWANAGRQVRPARPARALRRRRAAGDAGDRPAPRPAARAAGSRAAGRGGRQRAPRAGEQALLFLNRRGYAPLTICRACGHQVGCDDCDARMVEHRFRKRLVCHQCGATKPIPDACPACKVEGRMTRLGPGVERLAEEAAGALARRPPRDPLLRPRRRRARAEGAHRGDRAAAAPTSSSAPSSSPRATTSRILTLVGVIDADLGLQGGDLRAAEKTFQLIRQVAGRAGRAERRGLALVQTHQPEHPAIRALLSGDDEAFSRRGRGAAPRAMPPYGRLAGVVVTGTDEPRPGSVARALARRWRRATTAGACSGRRRRRSRGSAAAIASGCWSKSPRAFDLSAYLRDWFAAVPKPKGKLSLEVDVDPQSFL